MLPKSFYAEVLAFRVDYPDVYELELLEEIVAGDETARQALDEFRAERAAGLCTMEAYQLKYPQFFEQELQAA